jgi:serine palmitoyltransferase
MKKNNTIAPDPEFLRNQIQRDDYVRLNCTNLASYNYLGFGGPDSICTPFVKQALLNEGFSSGCSRGAYPEASHSIHRRLEKKIALFTGKEDAIVMGRGN